MSDIRYCLACGWIDVAEQCKRDDKPPRCLRRMDEAGRRAFAEELTEAARTEGKRQRPDGTTF